MGKNDENRGKRAKMTKNGKMDENAQNGEKNGAGVQKEDRERPLRPCFCTLVAGKYFEGKSGIILHSGTTFFDHFWPFWPFLAFFGHFLAKKRL
jgi:hypothetical protein